MYRVDERGEIALHFSGEKKRTQHEPRRNYRVRCVFYTTIFCVLLFFCCYLCSVYVLCTEAKYKLYYRGERTKKGVGVEIVFLRDVELFILRFVFSFNFIRIHNTICVLVCRKLKQTCPLQVVIGDGYCFSFSVVPFSIPCSGGPTVYGCFLWLNSGRN